MTFIYSYTDIFIALMQSNLWILFFMVCAYCVQSKQISLFPEGHKNNIHFVLKVLKFWLPHFCFSSSWLISLCLWIKRCYFLSTEIRFVPAPFINCSSLFPLIYNGISVICHILYFNGSFQDSLFLSIIRYTLWNNATFPPTLF